MNLSPNFTLEELTHSEIAERQGIDNTPDEKVKANLVRLARLLEEVRRIVGRPIMVNSAYRSLKVNELVGSKPTSQHCIGCAADIKVPGLTPDDIVKQILKTSIEYDQLIREFDSWVHISIPNVFADKPRKQVLIIDKNGTRPYK
jgi:zinc D-Ala-D-Ala carboxypeptidase